MWQLVLAVGWLASVGLSYSNVQDLLPFVEASGQHSESTKTAAARLPEAWAWDSNNITSGTFYPWLLQYRQILYRQ